MSGATLAALLAFAALFIVLIAIRYRLATSRPPQETNHLPVQETTGTPPRPKSRRVCNAELKAAPRRRKTKECNEGEALKPNGRLPAEAATRLKNVPDEIYLDIETQRLSYEVPGGWSNIEAFRVSIAVTWDPENDFRVWTESQVVDLIAELRKFARIVTYNGDRFDIRVLAGYEKVSDLRPRFFDVLAQIRDVTGRLVSLDHVCSYTLGAKKSGDGIAAVRWWREGKVEKVATYCRHDVELLMRLVAFARENGYVVIDGGQVKVNWALPEAVSTDQVRLTDPMHSAPL